MVGSLKHQTTFCFNPDFSLVPDAVLRIKETRGLAYAKFSGRPISLCKSLERRGELRIKFEEPIYLWPVDVDGETVTCTQSQPIVSVSRDISWHGIGFCYDETIQSDHVIAEFDLFGEGTIYLLVEVRWTSQTAPHAYVGGGLLLGVATVVH